MATMLANKDAYTLMNALSKEALGASALTARDTSSFLSAGENIMGAGYDKVLGAISAVFGKTIIGLKPYKAKMTIFQTEDNGLYTSRFRKISYLTKQSQAAGWVNTDINPANLKNGRDNTASATLGSEAVGTMWEQNQPIVLEHFYGGINDVWDFSMTVYPDQIKQAFRSEADFVQFFNSIAMEKENEIQYIKEGFNRMVLCNYLAGLYYFGTTPQTVSGTDYYMPGSAVNLTAEFNTKFGTSYTTAQLLSTHIDEFRRFLVATVKKLSNYMEEATVKYHLDLQGAGGEVLVRHTPKADQRLMLLEDVMLESETFAFPELFNPSYLDIKNYESVGFWQNQNSRSAINIKPAIPTVSSHAIGNTQTYPASAQSVATVIGVLFDKDAIGTNFSYEGSAVSPLEARKKYYNVWYQNMKSGYNDFTENGVLLYCEDPAPTPDPGT